MEAQQPGNILLIISKAFPSHRPAHQARIKVCLVLGPHCSALELNGIADLSPTTAKREGPFCRGRLEQELRDVQHTSRTHSSWGQVQASPILPTLHPKSASQDAGCSYVAVKD